MEITAGTNITNTVDGVHYQSATVVESCSGCAPEEIILSPSAFEELTGTDNGVVNVSWALFDPSKACQGSA
jgi:hypothetical protein